MQNPGPFTDTPTHTNLAGSVIKTQTAFLKLHEQTTLGRQRLADNARRQGPS